MGWVGLPKTIHCNETKRTHSMRYLLLCAIISWPAVGGLAYWPVPAVGPKERIGMKVRTSWRETRSYRRRRIKRMARPLPSRQISIANLLLALAVFAVAILQSGQFCAVRGNL